MSDLGEEKPKKRTRKAPAETVGETPVKARKPRAKAAKPAPSETEPAALGAATELEDVFREDDPFARSVAETLTTQAEPSSPVEPESETDLATLLAQFGEPDAARIELAPVLDRNAAVALHGGLLAARNRPVEIDASKVERLGGQCAQILLSAVATWAADARPLSVVDPSEGFERDCKLLGLGMHDFQPTDLTQ